MGEVPRVRVPRKNIVDLKKRAEHILRVFGARVVISFSENYENDNVELTNSCRRVAETVTETVTETSGGSQSHSSDQVLLVPLEIFLEPPHTRYDEGQRSGGNSNNQDNVSEIAARVQVSLFFFFLFFSFNTPTSRTRY